MKTILICIITAVLSLSCSTDDYGNPEKVFENPQELPLKISYPENAANPFDSKGKELYKALTLYYENRKSPRSVAELAEQIRYISAKLHKNTTVTGRLIPFTDEMVQSIMDDPDNSMILIVQDSGMNTHAKTNLIHFLGELIIKRQQDFSAAYNFIADYETDVVNDSTFSSEEKETLLTVSSISRYSLYSAEERKDKDWDILIGNKAAASSFKTGEASLIVIISLLQTYL